MHHRYLGRGPKTASTFHHGNVLVTLMHDVLTHAEKSLTENGQIDAVNTIRHLFQEAMAADSARLSSGSRAARWWYSSAATTSTPTSRPSCSSSTDRRTSRTTAR